MFYEDQKKIHENTKTKNNEKLPKGNSSKDIFTLFIELSQRLRQQ
jgi:hypothetical protein